MYEFFTALECKLIDRRPFESHGRARLSAEHPLNWSSSTMSQLQNC